ncbi:hypothetical protein [Nitrosopumilus sp.]|uniref:hypothetical protein n=1 Tax=Nitrosopumilus sp. TaxID=2024843 RepID=UPI0034A09C9B
MSSFECGVCKNKFELSEECILYDSRFFHKKCDPRPDIPCFGIISKKGMSE